jgi:Cft2 family RNA processing exonuclease
MKIHIAGGKGEHGRNCFYLDDGENAFLLDCGIMADDKENPYPHLTDDEISKLKVVFFSHSHADHTGAAAWLLTKGFTGYFVATEETFEALKDTNVRISENLIFLNDWEKCGFDKKFNLKIKYAKTGHCIGSVYLILNFTKLNKIYLYTGDYVEHTKLYKCSKIRNLYADLAIIDCAYGNCELNYRKICKKIVKKVRKTLIESKNIVFPLPKNGRALELLVLLDKKLKINEKNFFADDFFFEKFNSEDSLFYKSSKWFKKDLKKYAENVKLYSPENDEKGQIIFVCDPQLKNEQSLKIAQKIINDGGKIIFTGTVESDTPASKLLESGFAEKIVYPVHQNKNDVKKLCKKNHFSEVITFHCAEEKKD